MRRRLLLGLAILCAHSAHAAEIDAGGYADLRLIVPPTQGSSYYGDIGTLRFGYDDGNVAARLTDVVGEMRAHLLPELTLAATARIEPRAATSADLLEAYVRYSPAYGGTWHWSAKAGAFFPPGSLENDQIGWTSGWTITPSAINSWMGYELRTIGAEGTIEWRQGARSLALTGAVYGWNDPAGVLIADRGWDLDDRVSGLFERERLPDAMAVLFHTNPPLHAELFREIDGRPGWYLDLSWRQPGLDDFSVMYYDNDADPSARSSGQLAWRTRFWNAGFRRQIANVTVLAQALTGSTEVRPSPAFRSVTNFSSAYALGGLDLGDWRLATRVDLFRTHTLATFPSTLSENGCAGTFDATWFPRSWLQLTGEFIVVDSTRPQRTLVGEPASETERQLQLLARFSI